MRASTAAFIAALVLWTSGIASATVITPVAATGSSQYATYPASDAVDTGAGRYTTDWAANGTGNGSFLNLDLGAVYSLANALITDRTTSGGDNGTFKGGTADFTTQFSVQAYTDATFATTFGPALTFMKAVPSNPTATAQFLYTALLNGLTTEFVRYTVVAANGPNPGLADIEFTTVPEPASFALLIALGKFRRRNTQRPSLSRE